MKAFLFLLAIVGAVFASTLTVEEYFNRNANMDLKEAIQIISGILEKLNVNSDVEHLKECVGLLPNLITEIENVIKDFQKLEWRNLDEVFKMFSKFFNVMKELFDGLSPCVKSPEDIKNLIKKIGQIDTNKLLLRILAHSLEIFSWITDAIKDLQDKDYTDFGREIGKILYIFLLEDSMSVNPFIEFLNGFLEGINEKGDIKKILECVQDGEGVIEKVISALQYLIHIDFKHIEDIIKGVMMLVDAVKEIIKLLEPCAESANELKKIVNAIMNINLFQLAWKIISHAAVFMQDITDAIKAFSTGNFKQGGKDVGELLYLMLLSTVSESDPIFDFISGFLEGVNEKGDINNLLKCIKDVEPIITKIIQALELIAHLKFQDIFKGVTMLIQAVTDLMHELKPCTEGFEQLKKLYNAIVHADIMKIVTKIITNPGPFINDVVKCISDFKAGKLHDAGFDLGDIMFRLFLN